MIPDLLRAAMALPVPRVHRDHQEVEAEVKVHRVLLARLALMVRLEMTVHPAQMVLLDRLARMVRLVRMAQMDLLDLLAVRPVLLGQLVRLVRREALGQSDRLDKMVQMV